MKKIYLLPLIAVLFSACQSNNKPNETTSASDDKQFEQFVKDYIDDLWKTNPEWASSVGFHDYDDRSSGNSLDDLKANLKHSDEWYGRLKEMDKDKLSPANRIDYEMLQSNFDAAHFYFETYRSYEWDPTGYNIGGTIDATLNHTKLPLAKRMQNLSARLVSAPDYYKHAKELLKESSPEHCALAIQQNEGLDWFFNVAFPDSLKAAHLTAADSSLFVQRAATAHKAVGDYVDFLKKDIQPNAKRNPRIGKALYDEKFRIEIQAGESADDIYKAAQDRRRFLHHDMALISAQLWPKYFATTSMPSDSLKMTRMMIDKLSEQHCKPADLMETIERQLPELQKFIEEHDIITMDPQKPLKVRKTPDYMAGVAGASINSPGPYDVNATTWYNVTPLDHYSPAEAESYLREYNNYVLQILNIHEAIPGHYTQLIYANRSPSLVKSIFGNGAMIEGWACYVERMMIEEGYNRSPEMQLFYDKWNLRECSNAILDHDVHCNNMQEADAMKLLVDEAFQQTAEAKEKYHRAIVTNVQLSSYFTGLTEIYQLREDYKKAQGSHYSLKKFHEEFLSYGSAPVKYIRDLMLPTTK